MVVYLQHFILPVTNHSIPPFPSLPHLPSAMFATIQQHLSPFPQFAQLDTGTPSSWQPFLYGACYTFQKHRSRSPGDPFLDRGSYVWLYSDWSSRILANDDCSTVWRACPLVSNVIQGVADKCSQNRNVLYSLKQVDFILKTMQKRSPLMTTMKVSGNWYHCNSGIVPNTSGSSAPPPPPIPRPTPKPPPPLLHP